MWAMRETCVEHVLYSSSRGIEINAKHSLWQKENLCIGSGHRHFSKDLGLSVPGNI